MPRGEDQFVYRVDRRQGQADQGEDRHAPRRARRDRRWAGGRATSSSPPGIRRSATAAPCGCSTRPRSGEERRRQGSLIHVVISELSIRRPVFATVMSLVVVLLGLVSYQRLTVREYPNIDPPVVTVNTTYHGRRAPRSSRPRSPRCWRIRSPASRASTSSPRSAGRKTARSRSASSSSRDPDSAAADVRDRVGRVRGRLPDEIDEPVIQKVEADAQPIIYLAFSSDRHSAARNHRLRRPLRQGPAADAARRRGGAYFRRAALFDAHLARSGAARRL